MLAENEDAMIGLAITNAALCADELESKEDEHELNAPPHCCSCMKKVRSGGMLLTSKGRDHKRPRGEHGN